MRNPPPHDPNHFHFARQYSTARYVVFDTVVNKHGDTFRIWLPKALSVSEDQIFPAFCTKARGDGLYTVHTGMSAARVRAATKRRRNIAKTPAKRRKNARVRR